MADLTVGRPSAAQRFLFRRNTGMIVALGAVLAVLAVRTPQFYSLGNFRVLGLQMAVIGLAAVGSAFLLISGNVDLSIGSVFGLTAVVTAMLAKIMHPGLAMVAGIVLAAGIGWIMGALVWRISVSPIIITLAGLTIIRGVSFLITQGSGVRHVPESFRTIGQATPLGIPSPIWALAFAMIVGHFMLSRTTGGRYVYAIGGGSEASARAGLPVRRLTLTLFTMSGVLVGIASVLTASRFGSASPTFGTSFELDVLTAVILGGVAFKGGEGDLAGVMLAVALLTVIDSALVSLGVDPFLTNVVKGSALLSAVTLDQLTLERQEAHRRSVAMAEHAMHAEERRRAAVMGDL